jgi:phage host-nuclease inhibitor protein Gam
MPSIAPTAVAIPSELVEAIRSLPAKRIVEHCGTQWSVSPFDIYAQCPHCGVSIKVRSFSACVEIEDVFDAVFEWMNQAGAEELIRHRREMLKADDV